MHRFKLKHNIEITSLDTTYDFTTTSENMALKLDLNFILNQVRKEVKQNVINKYKNNDPQKVLEAMIINDVHFEDFIGETGMSKGRALKTLFQVRKYLRTSPTLESYLN
jgi:hypothetical protein